MIHLLKKIDRFIGKTCLILFMAFSFLEMRPFTVNTINYTVVGPGEAEVGTHYSYQDDYQFYSPDIVIPETVEYLDEIYTVIGLGDRAFSSCKSLNSVTLPSSVTYIGEYCFNESSLSSIELSSSLKQIGYCAFLSTSNLKDIKLTDSIEFIGERAFSYSGIETVDFGNCQAQLGKEAFSSSWNLSQFIVPDTNNVYASFDDCLYSKDLTEIFCCPSDKKEIVFPEGLKIIGDYAFDHNEINEFTLPEGVTTIGDGAFIGWQYPVFNFPESLEAIGEKAFYASYLEITDIPDNVSTIGYMAFIEIPSLKEVTLGTGVTYIGEGAFDYFYNLETLICKAPVPPQFDEQISNNTTTSLYVPDESYDLYSSAYPWSEFALLKKISELDAQANEGDIFETDGLFYQILSTTDLTVEVTYDRATTNGNNYFGDITIPAIVTYKDIDY